MTMVPRHGRPLGDMPTVTETLAESRRPAIEILCAICGDILFNAVWTLPAMTSESQNTTLGSASLM